MKKVLIALGCVAFFGLASCKKDYTCNCTVVEDSTGEVFSESSVELKDVKKSEAEDACEGQAVSAGGFTATCELE